MKLCIESVSIDRLDWCDAAGILGGPSSIASIALADIDMSRSRRLHSLGVGDGFDEGGVGIETLFFRLFNNLQSCSSL